MSFRIKSQKFINLSRRAARQESVQIVGVVGDKIKAEIELEWLSTYYGDGFNEIISTPNASEVGLPSGTTMSGYIYSPDSIFRTDEFKVGEKLAVFINSTINPVEFFTITDRLSDELIKIDPSGNTFFNNRHVLGANDWIGSAPILDSLKYDYSLNYQFDSFDVEEIGNGSWRAFEDNVGKNYTDVSFGINRQPFATFAINTLRRTGASVFFTLKIEHEFILYPFHLSGETAPDTPLRFQGTNCLNYYFQFDLSSTTLNNNRVVTFTSQNGNTGGIDQTINSGINKFSISNLSILNSASEPVTTQLQPDTYTAEFEVEYLGTLTSNADDDCKAWGYIEQEVIDNDKTLREFYQFDSATRNTGNFLTATASGNDFSDVILVNNVLVSDLSGNALVTIEFEVTDTTPQGNMVLCLNIEPNGLGNTRKNIFVFSLPIVPTPPDVGIRFGATAIQKHNSGDSEILSGREISPNQELLAINRFFVTIPNGTRVDRVTSRFVAQTSGGVLINTLEQSVIETAAMPIQDGVFQSLQAIQAKPYPRDQSDPFKNVILRRNELLDTDTERCYEVLTPYIFRYEDWVRFVAINGEVITPDAFDATLLFNGFIQVWQQYGVRFDNIIKLLVTATDGNQYTISQSLTSDGIEFVPYSSGTIAVTNTLVNDTIIKFGDNTVTGTLTNALFTNYSASDFVGIMWANIKSSGGVGSNQRVSSILLPDPNKLWKSLEVSITKPTTTSVRLSTVMDGAKVPNGSQMSVWADVQIKDFNTFEFDVKTDNLSSGSSTNVQFALPLVNVGTYDFVVDWGDGSSNRITSHTDANKTHTYASAGTYRVKITGTLRGWQFNNAGDRLKFIKVYRWGCLRFATNAQFAGCANLDLSVVSDVLNLSGVTSIALMFDGCTALTKVNRMNEWDVSLISNFFALMRNCINFDTYINDWNVTSAVGGRNTGSGLHGLLFNCESYNQPMYKWDVSNCKEFNVMFRGAISFNQELPWDMRSALDCFEMFRGATAFNNDSLKTWKLESMTDLPAVPQSGMRSFMFGKTAADFDAEYLDNIYNSWPAYNIQNGVLVDFGTIDYTSAGAVGKAILEGTYLWTITDGVEI
jgi:hypothetical protein